MDYHIYICKRCGTLNKIEASRKGCWQCKVCSSVDDVCIPVEEEIIEEAVIVTENCDIEEEVYHTDMEEE